MDEFITLALFGWGAFLLFLAMIIIAVVVKYFIQKQKDDHVNREEYLFDDFYMLRDRQ